MRHLLLSIFLIITSFSITSCGGSDSGPPQTGKVAVLFTDGPDERFEQILITLDRMLLLGGDGGHQIIYDGPEITFDLLDLRGRADFAFASDVLADDYSKIRLEVSEIKLVDLNGTETTPIQLVHLPANGKIDLNPQGPFTVLPGRTIVVELDMDANRSFHVSEQGNGGYQLRPVIFVNVYPDDNLLGNRLVRVSGTVESVIDSEKSALVCQLYFVPQIGDAIAGDADDCVRIFADDMTGIFGEDGAPAVFQDIVPMTSKLTGIGFVMPDSADALFELEAVVMEIGEHKPPSTTGWETLRGSVEPDAVCSIPDALDTFCFLPNDSATPIKTQLQAETQIFDTDGVILMPADINEMDIGTVDGLRITNGTEELRASLVVLSADPDPGLVSGVLAVVEIDIPLPEGTFDVLTLDTTAKVCVNEETDVLRILVDDGVVTIVDLLDPQVLVPNMDTVEATGTPSVVGDTGCDLIADVVIIDSL